MSSKLLKIHMKCRNSAYLKSGIQRFQVLDNFVDWKVEWPTYKPELYESPVILNKPWADNKIDEFQPKWNQLDGNVNRVSYAGEYKIQNGYPLNPAGRTGLRGRGVLGRWGPNHAADPIVTRWKQNQNGEVMLNSVTNKRILQMCAIERHDCGEWAIPGGMVDPGEKVSVTLRREFLEEAVSTADNHTKNIIEEFFATKGVEIYQGYVDDPRNTDNAWMETSAFNYHDDSGEYIGKFNLEAGDDAANVKWLDIDGGLKLYASHAEMVKMVVQRLDAHW